MVFYFYPKCYDPERKDEFLIYMGKDKYENEDLIKYGLPTDVWFHVDDMSSAHVYLRLPEGSTYEGIPEDVLEECAQLVKANSIQGCKLNNITVIYTPWENLRKTASMDVGQIGFHSQKTVRKVKVEKKVNEIVNRLNKTMVELYPDLKSEQDAFQAAVRGNKRAEEKAQRLALKAAKDEHKRQEDLRSYKHVMKGDYMVSNTDLKEKYQSAEEYEDDFM